MIGARSRRPPDALAAECIGDGLIASVAVRVKMISSARSALREPPHLLARALVSLGRGIGEKMQARWTLAYSDA